MSDELIPAATVILGRDGAEGLEILMLRRSTKVGFGGAWVFPGGRIDDDDAGDTELARARSGAVRESMEETGLDISGSPLTAWSYWEPPLMEAMVAKGGRRRYATWFFLAEAPDAEVQVDMGEIHEHRWLTPAAVIALQKSGGLELVPPTFVTITQLSPFGSVADAIESRTDAPPQFFTRAVPGKPITLTWQGDVAYDDHELLDSPGPRNRLVMGEGDWQYERS